MAKYKHLTSNFRLDRQRQAQTTQLTPNSRVLFGNNSVNHKQKKQLLVKNSYYDDRILKTLLRSQSTSSHKKFDPTQNDKINKTAQQPIDGKFIAHHNMPIQSKVTKGINQKSKLQNSSGVSLFTSDRKAYRPRIGYSSRSNFGTENVMINKK